MAGTAVSSLLHVGKPYIPDHSRLNHYLDRAMDSAVLTNDGPLVRELEERLAEYLDVKHAICVSSGTVGLQIVAKALGLEDCDIYMPSWTFIATASAMKWIGLNPVFMDVSADHLMHRAMVNYSNLGVHTWGNECKLFWPALEKLIIYDAAHAFSPSWGQHGDAEVFSFHATKFFHTVEGGCITTASDELAARCRRLRNFGYENGEVVDEGINGKMSEVHAAWGLAMLPELSYIIDMNQLTYELYTCYLDGYSFVPQSTNFQYVVTHVENRDEALKWLHAHGILARRYFYPGIHRMVPHSGMARLPVTEWLSEHTLVLPTGPPVSESDIRRISDIIRRLAPPASML